MLVSAVENQTSTSNVPLVFKSSTGHPKGYNRAEKYSLGLKVRGL